MATAGMAATQWGHLHSAIPVDNRDILDPRSLFLFLVDHDRLEQLLRNQGEDEGGESRP